MACVRAREGEIQFRGSLFHTHLFFPHRPHVTTPFQSRNALYALSGALLYFLWFSSKVFFSDNKCEKKFISSSAFYFNNFLFSPRKGEGEMSIKTPPSPVVMKYLFPILFCLRHPSNPPNSPGNKWEIARRETIFFRSLFLQMPCFNTLFLLLPFPPSPERENRLGGKNNNFPTPPLSKIEKCFFCRSITSTLHFPAWSS